MAGALPLEQRTKIVEAYNNGLGTVREIAAIFKVTERAVYNYLKKYNETGDLTPKQIPGRPPILTDENLLLIKGIILENKDLTLEECKDIFYKKTNINVTIVTIFNALKILKLNRKKKVFSHQNKKELMSNKNEKII